MEVVLNFLQDLTYFILLIGVVVFFHEAGHFLVAKLCKVKVHAFSLGFGPKIVGFTKGETDYKIAAIPIGGYVKMLGEDPTEEILPQDEGRAFSDKPVYQRLAIVTAGPAMNVVLAFLIYFFVAFLTFEVVPAEIGYILPHSAADLAGIEPGDRIVTIDGEPIHSFDDLSQHVEPSLGRTLEVGIVRDGEPITKNITPQGADKTILLDVTEKVGRIGVSPIYLSPVLALTDPKGLAASAGLVSFDKVVAINDSPVERFVDLEKQLLGNAGRTVRLEVQRFKAGSQPPFVDAHEKQSRLIELTIPGTVLSLAQLGMDRSSNYVAYVKPDGAAAKIGLLPGDRLLEIDGAEASMERIISLIFEDTKKSYHLAWSRGQEKLEAAYKAEFVPAEKVKKDLGTAIDVYDIGFARFMPTVPVKLVKNENMFTGAVRYAVRTTVGVTRMLAIGIKFIFQGKFSLQSLGGPLMIGQLAADAGRAPGFEPFFLMTALISLNLGIFNLFPIPVLDGGHVVFLAIEAVSRRRVNRRIKESAMMAGVLMLLALMAFALRNDIYRIIYS